MAQFLGQIQPYPNTVADSLNAFAAQQQARKQANLKMAMDAIASGQYAPAPQGQTQAPGMMQKVQNAWLGPQVGGPTMNVMGTPYQQVTPQMQAEAQANKLKMIMSSLNGAPAGSTTNVDSSGGASMSYTPPDQLAIQQKQADIQAKMAQIKSIQMNQSLDAASKQLAIKKAQLELNKLQMTPQQKASVMTDTITDMNKQSSQPQQQYTPEFKINANGDIETTLKPKDVGGLSALGDIGNQTPEELRSELKQKNPGYANYLDSLSAGRLKLTGRGTKQIAQIQQDLATLYPGMDMSQIEARYKTRQDFTTGTAAKNIKSLNTAVGHLNEMEKVIPQLKNSGFKMWNQLAQTATSEFGGNPTLARFKAIKVALSGELSNIYKNSGGTDNEIKQVSDTLDSADSEETLKTAVSEAISLMGSRLSALQDQWHNAYNRDDDPDFPVISQRSKNVLRSLGYDDTNNSQPDEAPDSKQSDSNDPLGIR